MGGNYEKGMYNQLMEVMARLDAVGKDLHGEKIEHKDDVVLCQEKVQVKSGKISSFFVSFN